MFAVFCIVSSVGGVGILIFVPWPEVYNGLQDNGLTTIEFPPLQGQVGAGLLPPVHAERQVKIARCNSGNYNVVICDKQNIYRG